MDSRGPTWPARAGQEQGGALGSRKLLTEVPLKARWVRKGSVFSTSASKQDVELGPEMTSSGSNRDRPLSPTTPPPQHLPQKRTPAGAAQGLHPAPADFSGIEGQRVADMPHLQAFLLELLLLLLISFSSPSSIQHRASVTPSAWDIPSRPCSYQWTTSNGSSSLVPGLPWAAHWGTTWTARAGSSRLKKKKKKKIRCAHMRTTPFSPCALPTLRKPVVLWVPHHSVFRGHSLDASHQVSSSRQRKVWLTTASPQAISTCCEGVLHQAGIIRFKVAYTEPSKEAFSCQQGMKKWVETECVGSNVPRYPRLWDSPKTSRLLPGASRWST